MNIPNLDSYTLARKGKELLCFTIFVALGAFVICSFIEGDRIVLPLFFGVLVGGYLLFIGNNYFWPACVASLFFTGHLTSIPAEFTVFEIALVFGVARFATEYFVFKKQKLLKGPKLDLLLICGFTLIVLLHGLRDRFGMRFLGSSLWGGRAYFTILLPLCVYFILQSIPYRSEIWRRFPFIVMIPLTIDLIIQIITYLFPAITPIISEFYSGVSAQEADTTERINAFGNLGMIGTICVFSFSRLTGLWRPGRWWEILVLIAATGATLYSGFRSYLIGLLLVYLAACIRDYRKLSAPMFGLVILGLSTLPLVHDNLVRLPKQVQRALVFMPGDWDADMSTDAEGSNDFRLSTWWLWYDKYFPQHPLLGHGFGFGSEWAVGYGSRQRSIDFYDQIVQTGNFHNGLISTVDAIGVVGALFLIPWSVIIFKRVTRYMFAVPYHLQHPALRWIGLYLFSYFITFWIGAGSVQFLVQTFLVCGALFLRIERGEHSAADEKAKLDPLQGATAENQSSSPKRGGHQGCPVASHSPRKLSTPTLIKNEPRY